MRNVSGLEAVYRDYGPKNVKFYFIYKALAHPERDGIVQPLTRDERLLHAREATKRLGNTIPFLVDEMDNRLKHALGDRNNSEFIVDPKGVIVRKRTWSSPDAVRKDLEDLVGKVEKITRVEDVVLKTLPAPKEPAAKGVATRIPRVGMSPLVAEPQISATSGPFYAKLRVEADTTVIDEGKGKLYIGFHLDPFYAAHWNNLKKPVRFQIELPDAIRLSRTSAQAEPVKAETDIDPREFLLDVEVWPEGKTARLTVTYAACTDDVCHELQQTYILRRERDRDGGRVMNGFRARSPEEAYKRLMDGDKNADGKLTSDELNAALRSRFNEYDANKDGVLDKDEILKLSERVAERKKQ